MVSLKSFKPINEIETDDLGDTLQLSPQKTTHQLYQLQGASSNIDSASIKRRDEFDKSEAGSSAPHHLACKNHRLNEQISSQINEKNNNLYLNSKSIDRSSPRAERNSESEESEAIIMDQRESKSKDERLTDSNQTESNVHAQAMEEAPEGKLNKGRAIVNVTYPPARNDATSKINSNTNSNDTDATSDKLTNSPTSSSISIVVVRHDNERTIMQHEEDFKEENQDADHYSIHEGDSACETCHACYPTCVKPGGLENSPCSNETNCNFSTVGAAYPNNLQDVDPSVVLAGSLMAFSNKKMQQPLEPMQNDMSQLSVNTESDHFEIVWTNLKYRIEPKWHKKYNYLDQLFTFFLPGQTVDNHSSANSTASSAAAMNENRHHASNTSDSNLATHAIKPRSPCDPIEIFTNLNGTIKSGQMTAVLGPSGEYIS